MAQTTKTTPSLIAQLYARDAAQAVDNRRAAGARAYLAPLDNHARALGYPGGILAAIDAEVAELAGCDDKVRAASEAALKQHPDPPPGARRRVANAERALRNTALGALNVLDSNPALLSDWRQRITSIPDDAGPNHAEAHWLCIWPLLGRARGLLAVPAALDAQARALGVLVEAELAQGQPVEVSPGRGPLPETERPRARGSYRAVTVTHHD